MLAPIALEHEEARHFKQEEIIRDHDLWDDPGKSNEILIKLVDSAKVVDAFKDLKYKASLAVVDVIPLFLESLPGLLIDNEDLLVYCSSSSKKPGKISSSISIQHIPTGVEVQSAGERC
ncbi:peptide chain release factor 3, chloroplastic [Olea europaea subsp. europaea]|uniref:Peptide chain release factor 3, chloroplastic n=1 Tax=Olea europaea subsp. europaea TaxID=158383 RepID=A0A8S0UB14_OLEEU|nr:peptide chain release factor 3, chloroplastic [Olea europaea subsp. europaea]